jgi:RNA polymerase sigma-70 factor (ECF subfamily)
MTDIMAGGSALDFQKVHDEHRPKVLRYLARMVGEYAAEDLTQEVFVKVSRSLPDFRGGSRLSTWIYRIAVNTAIDMMRSLSYRRDRGRGEADDMDACAAPDPSIDCRLMTRERLQCLQGLIGRMAPAYRRVFVLSELEHLTNNEISRVLGVSLDTVKIRLHRGRVMLAQAIRSHCRAEDWL